MEIQTKLFQDSKFWTNYNKSQTQEKTLFLKFLKEICDVIPDKKTRQMVFCICLKTYTLKSSRRLIGELDLCRKAGYLEKVPHFNSILNWLNRNDLTDTLQTLIKLSSLPLKAIERKFACDSTGFGMDLIHDRWSQIRQQYQKHHKYMKAHVTFGVLSNIATSCRITEGTAADSPMMPEMVDETAENFTIDEWSADKGYLARSNLQKVFDKGGTPFIQFKENSVGNSRGTGIWSEMYNFFYQNKELYMKKYHLRSNAESGFFMIKQRFGDVTMMRSETGSKNDILAKILCHNLCVLIQEIFLIGLDFNFAQIKRQVAHLEI